METPFTPPHDTPEQQLQSLQAMLFAFASLAELRESDTENHILRVQHYVRALTLQLQTRPEFAPVLTPGYIASLCQCVPVYDLGTVGVPDRILLKPGRLDSEELGIMRTHTQLGYDALVRAEKKLGCSTPMLAMAKEVALSHQEKWDGSGYPRGLSGALIPLPARIIALADVYDALITSKVYKSGVPHDRAMQIIFSERGAHFDPDLVDVFMEIENEFALIALRFADTEADMQQKIEYMANAIAEVAVL